MLLLLLLEVGGEGNQIKKGCGGYLVPKQKTTTGRGTCEFESHLLEFRDGKWSKRRR